MKHHKYPEELKQESIRSMTAKLFAPTERPAVCSEKCSVFSACAWACRGSVCEFLGSRPLDGFWGE